MLHKGGAGVIVVVVLLAVLVSCSWEVRESPLWPGSECELTLELNQLALTGCFHRPATSIGTAPCLNTSHRWTYTQMVSACMSVRGPLCVCVCLNVCVYMCVYVCEGVSLCVCVCVCTWKCLDLCVTVCMCGFV